MKMRGGGEPIVYERWAFFASTKRISNNSEVLKISKHNTTASNWAKGPMSYLSCV